VFDNLTRVIRWQFGLNTFQYTQSFVMMALPSVIIAERVLGGHLEVGRAVQAAGAFAAMLSALTLIVERFESLSRFAAGVARLHTFLQTLGDPMAGTPAQDAHILSEAGTELRLDDVTVLTPGRERVIVRELNLNLPAGGGLMITGPSGVGKSSLLRAIAGLWTTGSGRIERPEAADLMFLPQQPYLTRSDLRSQLLYPDLDRSVSDAELASVLQQVRLGDLVEQLGGQAGGLHAVRDWAKLLSVGEQQRLVWARVLLARPRYVMLDEATSALDSANEEALYALLQQAAITPISVSHRASLLRFHQQVLELAGEGAWSLHAAQGYRMN
jgi:putative ATP-binding cassette transporter